MSILTVADGTVPMVRAESDLGFAQVFANHGPHTRGEDDPLAISTPTATI
jgi:hypothetical protein